MEGLSFGEDHSAANQNINNLKYVYRLDDKEEIKQWKKTEDIINKIYSDRNVREFNKVHEVEK